MLWRLLADGNASAVPPRSASPVEDVRAAALVTPVDALRAKGNAAASVVLIEFGDFECPYCGRYARDTFGSLEREFIDTGKVRYAFRHLPSPRHRFARPAARAAECAAHQSRFWEMHRFLYENQTRFADAVWLTRATGDSIDVRQLEECLGDSDESRIQADLAEASRLKVQGTPTFLVGQPDGKGNVRIWSRINGAQPYTVFRDALNRLLAES